MRMIITDMVRIENDINGNPRYRVTFDTGRSHNTTKGAGFVYEMTLPVTGEHDVIFNQCGTIDNIAPIPDIKICRRCGKTLPRENREEKRRMNILWNHPAAGACVMSETEMSR